MADQLRPDIADAVGRMGNKMGTKGEVKALEGKLVEGERVECLSGGRYKDGNGLVVLTDRRILFVLDAWTRSAFEAFTLAKVTSVEWKAGMITGKLSIHASGSTVTITHMAEVDGRRLAEAAQGALVGGLAVAGPVEYRAPAVSDAPEWEQPSASAGGGVDPLAVLAQLRALRDEGRLSARAYEAVAGELAML